VGATVTDEPQVRDKGGRFLKGVSGNPAGVPAAIIGLRALARSHCPEAIEGIRALFRSDDESIRLRAYAEMLDRGYGKAAQVVAGDDEMPPVGLRATLVLDEESRRLIQELLNPGDDA
jgi:hypothetical protein